MGPWYLNAAHTTTFPKYLVNTKTLWRFPRSNMIPAVKTPTGLSTIGLLVDSVAMFDSSDGFYWNGSGESGDGGTGYWHREAYANEGVSFDSKFDRALLGKEKLTVREQRGFKLLMTDYEPRTENYGADCFHCHGGALFSDHQFHNNGLSLTEADLGRFKVTKLDANKGKFSTPSLRNVALTAPYMHDGRFRTLEEVVAHYDHSVQRGPTLDPNLAKHPPEGLRLPRQDQAALVAFLKTLTDGRFTAGK